LKASSAAVVVPNDVGALDAKSVEEADDHRRLHPKRPVGVFGCLGVAQAKQVRGLDGKRLRR